MFFLYSTNFLHKKCYNLGVFSRKKGQLWGKERNYRNSGNIYKHEKHEWGEGTEIIIIHIILAAHKGGSRRSRVLT